VVSDAPAHALQIQSSVATQQRRDVLGTAVQVVFLLVLLSILAAVVAAALAVVSLVNSPARAVTDVGSGLTSVARQAQQAVQNATDPNHPPSGLTYDTEFLALPVWRTGERLPDATDYVLSLKEVRRRDGATTPDTALYAVVHAELRQPRETRVFGQVVHSDPDAHDYVVYKGETFRIGHALFRVNWISQETASIAAGQYRHPDEVNTPVKFEYD
jgi:hypothetical protein